VASSQVLERIRKELIDSERDSRYLLGAYEYVLNGMEFYLTSIGEKRHVSGQELTKGLLLFAQKQFGLLAGNVLHYWGIYKTDDLGNIVYNMIDINIMSKQEDDSIDHFRNVLEIDAFLEAIEYYQIDKERIKKLKDA
jgi:uncharacterized repeat protein (TIGR04138 family)